jgi:hypothetical protein
MLEVAFLLQTDQPKYSCYLAQNMKLFSACVAVIIIGKTKHYYIKIRLIYDDQNTGIRQILNLLRCLYCLYSMSETDCFHR